MTETPFFNIDGSLGAADVDAINSEFYAEINYPWAPMILPVYQDGAFWPEVMNHELGRSGEHALRPDMKIWVAGCGTNQAVLTALRFPEATVIGSDISTTSLETCRKLADQAGATNLTLREESLNEVIYRGEFDYVLCTGVVHHNADPAATLRNVAKAVKPTGVMELMIYNFYHRILTTAYQKAIRILAGSGSKPDIEKEMPLTRALIERFPVANHLSAFLDEQKNAPPAAIADYFLQPVEYSYTVYSFRDLCREAGLELTSYCVNQFDNMNARTNWMLDIADERVRQAHLDLPDIDRWQVTNLLLGELTPLLWFFTQPENSTLNRRTDAEAREAFLDTIYMPRKTYVVQYRRQGDGYKKSDSTISFPVPARPACEEAALVYDNCDGYRPMRVILKALRIDPDPRTVETLRNALITTGNPYLEPRRAEG